jgi:thiamine-phosphate pyrophosphorylase
MIICLVTDRRRRPPIEQAAEAVDAGVDLIQIRERDLDTSALVSLVLRVVELTRRSPTRVVVNDRVDVALACGAHGVHLRADSVPASLVRSIVPQGFALGRSVHEGDEAVAVARDVDYLIAGTVFPTASKPGRIDLLGLNGLASIAAAVRVPVLAIGGITLERAAAVAATGAAGIAALGLFADADRPIKDVVRALRARFNISGGATFSA